MDLKIWLRLQGKMMFKNNVLRKMFGPERVNVVYKKLRNKKLQNVYCSTNVSELLNQSEQTYYSNGKYKNNYHRQLQKLGIYVSSVFKGTINSTYFQIPALRKFKCPR
jgi:hypothetical protein